MQHKIHSNPYRYSFALIALVLMTGLPGRAAPFQNLDFEQLGNRNLNQTNFTQFLPGWSANEWFLGYGETELIYGTVFWFNGVCLAPCAQIVLVNDEWASFGSTNTFGEEIAYWTIEGTNSVLLRGGTQQGSGNITSPQEVSICQTGDVPPGATNLYFCVRRPELANFTVSMNQTNLSVSVLQSNATAVFFTADISSWAGQTAVLKFTSTPFPHFDGTIGESFLILDAISFSEPAELTHPGDVPVTGIQKIEFLPSNSFGIETEVWVTFSHTITSGLVSVQKTTDLASDDWGGGSSIFVNDVEERRLLVDFIPLGSTNNCFYRVIEFPF
ncbi:MAG: hypothetical protein AAF492_18060 [Verrucomicrobiota bacterium]